jgi:tartrate-resistant acid phosphatase type 5
MISFGHISRSFITTTFLFLLIISQGFAQKKHSQNAIDFFVLGDWGREGKSDQTKVAIAMAKQARHDKPDFILSTGDNFYDNGVASIHDKQWNTSWKNIYAARPLQIPWYVALGNHDYHTNAEVEVEYTKHSKLWNMPARYFAFEEPVDDTTTALFLILDTSPFVTAYQEKDEKYHVSSQSTTRQLEWMDSVLSHSKAKWKFAAGHHPIYSAAGKHGDTHELIDNVLPIFQRYHVQAYFCGHDHNLQRLSDRGLTSYVSGGGSESREDITKRGDLAFGASSTGFLEIKLSSDMLQASFYNSKDTLLDASMLRP